jgi:hypothetical protein
MSDEQLRCQNPARGLPIEVIPGYRRRKYCDERPPHNILHVLGQSKLAKGLVSRQAVSWLLSSSGMLSSKIRILRKGSQSQNPFVPQGVAWRGRGDRIAPVGKYC